MSEQNNNSSSIPRKKREEEFRRKLVLEAAEFIIAEKGYDHTTVADIAARAELAKGSLYQLFQSKEEIFAALIEDKLNQVLAHMDLILTGDQNPVEKIHMVIQGKLQYFWENRDFARIFMKEFKGFHMMMTPEFAERHEHGIIEFQKMIEKVLEEGQNQGEFRTDVSAATLVAALTGFTNGIIIRWLKDPESIDYNEAVRKVGKIFLHGASAEKS